MTTEPDSGTVSSVKSEKTKASVEKEFSLFHNHTSEYHPLNNIYEFDAVEEVSDEEINRRREEEERRVLSGQRDEQQNSNPVDEAGDAGFISEALQIKQPRQSEEFVYDQLQSDPSAQNRSNLISLMNNSGIDFMPQQGNVNYVYPGGGYPLVAQKHHQFQGLSRLNPKILLPPPMNLAMGENPCKAMPPPAISSSNNTADHDPKYHWQYLSQWSEGGNPEHLAAASSSSQNQEPPNIIMMKEFNQSHEHVKRTLSKEELVELRKFAHLNSEKKRRCKMNDAFQVLKNKIPSCGLNTNVTKMTILHEASKYIDELEAIREKYERMKRNSRHL